MGSTSSCTFCVRAAITNCSSPFRLIRNAYTFPKSYFKVYPQQIERISPASSSVNDSTSQPSNDISPLRV